MQSVHVFPLSQLTPGGVHWDDLAVRPGCNYKNQLDSRGIVAASLQT